MESKALGPEVTVLKAVCGLLLGSITSTFLITFHSTSEHKRIYLKVKNSLMMLCIPVRNHSFFCVGRGRQRKSHKISRAAGTADVVTTTSMPKKHTQLSK